MDCYSLAIQDMLNMFKITPDGENKDVWESFPENLHQIMIPLLTSRYVCCIFHFEYLYILIFEIMQVCFGVSDNSIECSPCVWFFFRYYI